MRILLILAFNAAISGLSYFFGVGLSTCWLTFLGLSIFFCLADVSENLIETRELLRQDIREIKQRQNKQLIFICDVVDEFAHLTKEETITRTGESLASRIIEFRESVEGSSKKKS